jgi:nitrate reductase gamma subunit
VEAWIEFGRGPLFRIAFSLMLLGLLRSVVLTAIGIEEAYRQSPDKIVNWYEVRRQTIAWLFPVARLWRQRPIYSTFSFLFHVGLLLVPPFLFAHVLLWKRSAGFAWFAIPQSLANYLTVLVVVIGMALFLSRVLDSRGRKLSRPQDFAWPLLLVVPFITGFLCTNVAIGPTTYQSLMLVHVYSANLIMLLIPFTKIAHCVLAPLSQVVTAIAWKFPAGAGDRVAATLGYADRPTWLPKARLEIATVVPGKADNK